MLLEVILILLTTAAYTYWWLLRRNKYWEIRNVVSRPPLLFYGNLKERLTFRTPFHQFYRQFYEDFKGHKYLGLYEGRIPCLMIRDPDLIKNILSKDFDHFVDRSTSRFKKNRQIEFMLIFISGNQWKKLRAAVTPTFTSGWITKHITLSFFNKSTVDFLAQVYKDTAKYRADNNIRRNDFLQLLLDAQKGVLEEEGAVESIHKEGAVVDEDVAIAQSVLFFIAGYETSSSLMSMVSYCLAQEQQVQDRLRSEIVNVMGDDQKLTYEKINDMHYLDMVLSETLRLYPPVARLDRVCSKPYKIDHIELPVGHRVCIPCIGIHMDPAYYPEPEKFIPERFTAEEKAKRHPYVYMPFGLGPRNCIGMRFAQMSTKIVLAHLVKNFIIEVDAETPLPFKYDKRSMLLKPEGGVLKVKLRAASY